MPRPLPKISVSKSKIHGTGVYAEENIKKGRRVIQYAGEKITSKEGTRRSEEHDVLTYVFILNDNYDIDGNVNGNDARYINHSCDPNCEIRIMKDKIYIYATREIKKGEELSYDYAFDAEEQHKCFCGKKKCRGFLNEPEEEDS